MLKQALTLRIFGFLASLILTLAAYFIIAYPEFHHLGIRNAIIVIFALAILQATLQFIFFLDIWREEGPRWNLAVFISTILIILTIILFSIWIMNHLNDNMMPMMST